MRLMVIAVGRLKSGPERELCDRYAERIRATAKAIGASDVKIVELAESRQRRSEDRKGEEAAEIRAHLPVGAIVVLFDERGKTPGSEEFAAQIQQYRRNAPPALAFIIGGPDGLAPDLRESAAAVVSFGKMTMPHQLVRVLVLEQLYRAITILTGHPYHRV